MTKLLIATKMFHSLPLGVWQNLTVILFPYFRHLRTMAWDLLDALCGFIEKLSFDHLVISLEWDSLDQILKSNIDLYQRRNGDVPTKISMIYFLYLYELSIFIISNTLTIILQLCRKTTPDCGRPNKPLEQGDAASPLVNGR